MLEISIEDEKEIKAALRLNQLNRKKSYQIALEVFLKFKDKYSNSASLMGLIGGQYWLLSDYKKCSFYYNIVTNLSPSSELGSYMLFLSLYHQKLVEEAFDELERFLSQYKFKKPLKNYPIAIKEFYEQIGDFTSKKEKQLITKYYNQFCLKLQSKKNKN